MKWKFRKLSTDEVEKGNIIKKINNLISNLNDNNYHEKSLNKICDGLWLGNHDCARNYNKITTKNIHCIINVTPNLPNYFDNIQYYNINIIDNDACNNQILHFLENGANIIHNALENNKNILVHCKRGHHRSASVVAFYLMKYKSKSLYDSIFHIKNCRRTAFSKFTCILNSLIDYESSKLLKYQ